MKKCFVKVSTGLLICMLLFPFLSSCSDDDDNKNSSSIIGTWTYEDIDVEDGKEYYDSYTLVFNKDNTGYIRNDYGSRGASSDQMTFDWSLTTASNGEYLLSVIYKSGDKYMDGPFSGGYAQWNRNVTIAGSSLTISTGNSTVMVFHRK